MHEVYQIRVSVDGPEPPIWRRLLVSPDTRLTSLSLILRLSLGWRWVPKNSFAKSPVEDIPRAEVRRLCVRDVLPFPGDRLTYVYDLDCDEWSHTVTLEDSWRGYEELPVCVAGARATPRGRCMGPWHYQAWLQSMRDPATDEARENCLYARDSYDPEQFDCAETNDRLMRYQEKFR